MDSRGPDCSRLDTPGGGIAGIYKKKRLRSMR